jgi:predicted YcjX-like family ATPase
MVEFGKWIGDAGRWTADTMKEGIGQIDRSVNESVIRLAVTGLSRSGKTVFITSLIQNLRALGAELNSLPEFTNCLYENGKSRLTEVSLIPAGAEEIPWFDFPAKLDLLSSDDPKWPRPTDDLATIVLQLELNRKNKKFLGKVRTRIEILDYPGEWLLDLPLLNHSFQEWSKMTLEMMQSEPRAQCFSDFKKYIDDRITPDGKFEESSVRRAHQLYKNGLMKCREVHGLQYLQPGRFICPGPKGSELPFLWFFPLEIGSVAPKYGSISEQLVMRFEKYKSYVKEEFIEPYFNKFNRQIMLVDVLTALYNGRIVFNDTKRAINEISKALSSLKITKLAVAATKADHVPSVSRQNLALLVKDMTNNALVSIKSKVSFHAIASVDSTTGTRVQIGDKSVSAVAGMLDGKLRPYYVGEVPPSVPEDSHFEHEFFSLPGFQPRKFDPTDGTVKQFGVDKVLKFILGDDL